MWHLGSSEHFSYNGQGLHRVGITLSDVSMQKSVRLPKVVVIIAAERASSYIWLDETLTGKIRRGDLL